MTEQTNKKYTWQLSRNLRTDALCLFVELTVIEKFQVRSKYLRCLHSHKH